MQCNKRNHAKIKTCYLPCCNFNKGRQWIENDSQNTTNKNVYQELKKTACFCSGKYILFVTDKIKENLYCKYVIYNNL